MNISLAKSYDLEKRGLEFYISASLKTKNVLAKRTLFSLAQEEIKHMMKIDEISLAVDKDGKWPNEPTGLKGIDIEVSIKEFFEKTKKEITAGDDDNASVIKKAMEFERKSYELYSELSKQAGSDSEKLFYDGLKKQEEEHYEALENVYHYLAKTGDWFEAEESKAWNWMNL